MEKYIYIYQSKYLKKLGKLFDILFFYLFFFKKNKTILSEVNPKSILIFESHMLGDCVLTIGLINSIKLNYPDIRIDLLANSWMKSIVDPKKISNFYEVCVPWSRYNYTLKNLKHFFKTLIFIRKNSYDISIETRGDVRNNLSLFLIGSKRRLGINMAAGTCFLTDWVTPDQKISLIQKRILLLNKLGLSNFYFETDIYIRNQDVEEINKFIESNSLIGKKFILFHPGASSKDRAFSENEIMNLLEIFQNQFVVIAIGPNEKFLSEKLQIKFKKSSLYQRFLLFSGTINAYAELSKRALLIITMDSGPAHVSAASGSECFVIYNHNKPEFVKPYGKNVTMIDFENFNCVLRSRLKDFIFEE